MPAKRRQQPESESDEDMGPMNMGGMGPIDLTEDLDPHFSRKFLAKLSPEVRERVAVLEAMDSKYEELANEHEKKVMEIRRKYSELVKPIFEKRREIVTGKREPTDEEVKKGFPEEHEGEVSLTEGEKSDEKGIPKFWSSCLHHHVIIDEMISERDDDALDHLEDITIDLLKDDIGFTISFHFSPNAFFTNDVLSKTFFMKEVEDEYVLSKATGTEIKWKEGKNLGVEITQKKQKNKKGQVRYTSVETECETFFSFFAEGEEEEEEQNHAMAETIKDRIVPYAVEYFTGEADNGEDDIEGDEDGEEWGDDSGSDDEDESEEEAPRGRGGRRGGRGGAAQAQPDCKQQ